MSYIHDNQTEEDGEADEDEDVDFSDRMRSYLREIIKFLLECFNERFQILFYFRTCFFNFDLKLSDFWKTLYAFGKAIQKHQFDENGENNEGNEGNGGDEY